MGSQVSDADETLLFHGSIWHLFTDGSANYESAMVIEWRLLRQHAARISRSMPRTPEKKTLLQRLSGGNLRYQRMPDALPLSSIAFNISEESTFFGSIAVSYANERHRIKASSIPVQSRLIESPSRISASSFFILRSSVVRQSCRFVNSQKSATCLNRGLLVLSAA